MDEEKSAAGSQRAAAESAADAATVKQVALAPADGAKYSDLIAFAEATVDFRLPDQQARNRLSALSKYLDHLGLDAESPVGSELGSDLDETLVDFVRTKEKEGKATGTISNMRSFIRQWERMWKAYVELKSTPDFKGIGAAIAYYLEKAQKSGRKVNLHDLGVKTGHHDYYRQLVIRNTVSSKRTHEELAKLEEYLGAPPSSLTRFAATKSGLWDKSKKTNTTSYGRSISALQKDEYRLKVLPDRLLREVRGFIQFKTAASPLLERNHKWRTKPNEQSAHLQADLDIISVDGKTYAATAEVFLAQVRSFFGAKKVRGEDPETFSLIQMCDPQQLIDYLEFCKARMGVITEGAIGALENATALLYHKGGWLYQQPAFGALLPTPVSTEREAWHAWCDATRSNLVARLKKLKKDRSIKPGRDTQESIKDILDRQHPLTALFEMVDAMEKYLVKYESQPNVLYGERRVVLQRDILIVKILTAQPLRVKMLREMKYREDNTGNLYKRKTGEWCIRFSPEDFKNEAGAASDKAYDIPLPKDLYEDIEYYLSHVRRSPDFIQNDSVFVPVFKSTKKHGRKTKWINDMMKHRTRQFIEDCPGFGPHAIRHIVATDYIKNNPASYLVAADVLHDKLETVMKAYAHLKAADGHRVYLAYRQQVVNTWKKAA